MRHLKLIDWDNGESFCIAKETNHIPIRPHVHNKFSIINWDVRQEAATQALKTKHIFSDQNTEE